MKPIAFLLSLLLCAPALAADEPQWIWSPDNAEAPTGACYFRTTFDLADPEQGRVEITADNTWRLFVNGHDVGSGDTWQQLTGYDVTRHLVRGKNVVAVQASNSEGQAGMVARVVVKSKGSEAATHSTGAAWKTSLKAGSGWQGSKFDDSAWKPAHSYGPLGKTQPWGQVALVEGKPAVPEFTAKPRPEGKFELLDGDRVAFVGDTLIERAQANDYLETALTVQFPDRHVIYRNLGWSGDDVGGEARAGFGTAEDGFKQLKQQVYDFKPTVIFVAYGANASYAGPEGVKAFRGGYDRLLDMLASTKAVLILLSPIRQEDMGRPLPNPAVFNENRRLYTEAIRETAKERGMLFIDLFHSLGSSGNAPATPVKHLTDNGIHLTAFGYSELARVLGQRLEWSAPKVSIGIAERGKSIGAVGIEVFDTQSGDPLSFKARAERLPVPAPVEGRPNAGTLQIKGLEEGTYALKIDDREVDRGTAAEWAAGRLIESGPDLAQAEQLRRVILAKNQLFFHRWRPQNETYLFGFRKHEQGQNAKEIPMFDPLIEAKEKEIARLRVPVSHKYELVRAK